MEDPGRVKNTPAWEVETVPGRVCVCAIVSFVYQYYHA